MTKHVDAKLEIRYLVGQISGSSGIHTGEVDLYTVNNGDLSYPCV